MSSIYVNTIQAATGNTVTVSSGVSLSLGGTVVTSGSFLPTPSTANRAISSNGSSLLYSSYGAKNIQIFTASGTYVPSSGTRLVHVRLVGSGGGASGHGESGGSGGYAEGFVDVSSVSSVSITINAGGSPTYYSSPAGTGGTVSFGSYMSATGGRGGNQAAQHIGGHGGVGSGGTLNWPGGGGTGHQYCGRGGTNYFGGSVASGHPQTNYNNNHASHCVPGTGGTAGYGSSYPGTYGRDGMVVIWEYS